MREKKWIDCPVCGSKGTMKHKAKIMEPVKPLGYEAVTIGPLDGQFCTACGEGFYSRSALKHRAKQLAEAKAIQDSKKVPASNITDIDSLVKIMKVSRQRVHRMMDEGKIPYVYLGSGSLRLPIRQSDDFFRNIVRRQTAAGKNRKPAKRGVRKNRSSTHCG